MDDTRSSWSLQMTSGVIAFSEEQSNLLPFVEGLMLESVESQLPVVLNDAQVFDARNDVTTLDQIALKALAVLPIVAGARSLGALAMAREKDFTEIFTSSQVQFATVANQILGLRLANFIRFDRYAKEFVPSALQ